MRSATMFLTAGAISGFTSVAAGAFGAHGLRSRLPPNLLLTFETAARYQMYHALALCLLGVLGLLPARALDNRGAAAALAIGSDALYSASGFGFLAGTLLFSGSLYALALSGKLWLGMIAPLGGVSFLVGWLCLLLLALSTRGAS